MNVTDLELTIRKLIGTLTEDVGRSSNLFLPEVASYIFNHILLVPYYIFDLNLITHGAGRT